MSTALGAIAAGHELTAAAGEQVLRAGGNAYDAVLAAVTAAFVAEPVLASPGGGGFLLAAPAQGKPTIFDFFVQTPGRTKPEADLDFYAIDADFGGATQEFHIGLGSIAVPGQVRGMFDIHAALGSMPVKEVMAPAIEYARKGVKMNAYQAYLLSVVQATFTAGEECRSIFASREKEGALVQEGESLTQPQLADFLEVLAIEGPDLFYRGEVAQALDRDLRQGGLLTAGDLAAYETERRKPLEMRYRDAYIEMNAPPAAGGLLIGFGLKLFEQMDLQDLAAGNENYLQKLADVLHKTVLARAESAAQGGDLARILDPACLERYQGEVLGRRKAGRGTTHISVIDKDGNLASMTVSNGEGCGYVVPGTGIVMNNMLGEEDLNPAGFHAWETDTRLSSMMTPTSIMWPDGRRVAMGSGGSNRIRSAVLQVLMNLIDFDMPVADAVAAPRLHVEGDFLNIEGGFEPVPESLAADFSDYMIWQDRNMFFGGVHTVSFDGQRFDGAGDPRRSGVFQVV